MKVFYYTHCGLIRSKNEDALLINDLLISEKNLSSFKEIDIDEFHTIPYIFLVADGMGGHKKGEVASFLVLDYFRKQRNKIINQNVLLQTIHEAKNVLNQYAFEHNNAFGLGTVIVGLWIFENQCIVFNIGDSRLYRYKDNDFMRISKDHSVVEELKDAGYINEDDIRTHPERHIITSCIMGDHEKTIKSIFIRSYDKSFFEGSKVLLCSDGLWEMLYENELYLCMSLMDLNDVCNCLKQKAFYNGAKDNISFILINF